MRHILELEAVDDHLRQRARQFQKHEMTPRRWKLQACAKSPYCARIIGLRSHNRFDREFVKPNIDFSRANEIGSRGIFYVYYLASGIYECQRVQSWRESVIIFMKVNNRECLKISREEALLCLSKIGNAASE